jgi:glycosyltransferase involved in cell wall biosynthesis
LDAYRIVSKIFKKERIDLITTQDPYLTGLVGYMLKRKYGVPLIIQMHGEELDNKFWLQERRINLFFNILGKFLLKKADAVRVDSERIENYVRRKLKIPTQKIFRIPVFTFVEKFIRYNQKRAFKLKKKYSTYSNIVLYVGRLSIEKNLENLLNAAPAVLKKYPKTLFLLVGQGKEEERLRKLARYLGIQKNVVFEGFVKDVVPYYHMCDLFVLPSNYEGRAIVLVEALACSKPVISTDVSGARDVIFDGKTGYVVPLNDAHALAEKIIYLLNNPKRREQMGKRGQKYVMKTQDIKRSSHKLREMYTKVISRFQRD